MSEWKFTPEAILAARELAIGDRVICHWSEAECPDQEATVIGVQIERYGRASFAVIIDGDLSPTDGFYQDRSGHDAGSISLLRKYPDPASILHQQEERIAELTRERDSALEAEDAAKDCFWAIYPEFLKMGGGGISTEAARTRLSADLSASQARVKVLEEAIEPFGKYLDEVPVDLDNKGEPVPDKDGVGWVYLTVGDLRRARTALQQTKEKGNG